MKPLKQKISITLDMDVLKVTKSLAEENDRSLSQYINLILKKHIAISPPERPVISKLPADKQN